MSRLPAALVLGLLLSGLAQAQQGADRPEAGAAANAPAAEPEQLLQVRLVQAVSDSSRLFPSNETDPRKIPVNPFNPESLRFFFRVR